jgi:crotonobetainyl-CoA:carnitine CoA-transferase CaiB-like acyl-CoA transferase
MSEFSPPVMLPLEGIKVIDFGQPIAGSAVAMVLGDLGATVISIDRVGSFAHQPPYCATLNRNKQCVELDLKSSEGLKQALELISLADVVIDSFRPGVMLKFGIDYKALCLVNPGLITMSLPGFPSNDLIRRDWKGLSHPLDNKPYIFPV